MPQCIQNANVRVLAETENGRYYVTVWVHTGRGIWKQLLASGVISRPTIWTPQLELICEDPLVEWRVGEDDQPLQKAAGCFTAASVDDTTSTLTLSGHAGCHNIQEQITITGANRLHVVVTDRIAAGDATVQLTQLMTHLYFVPDGKAERQVEPLDFAWLPALHKKDEHICADHFFRSPAVIVMFDGNYVALIPDLKTFAKHRTIPHALDLRVTDTVVEAPRLSYGVCPSVLDGHVYFKLDHQHPAVVKNEEITYSFEILLGETESPEEVAQTVSSHLWSTYGHEVFEDVRPQVLPFEEYGRRYTYTYELPNSIRRVTINNQACVGIDNEQRRGANFHAWENDLHVGYGIRHYADKWGDRAQREIADGILQLTLNAPRKEGAFPCIYNFDAKTYEGSLFWTARCVDPYTGYDSAAMSVTAWWQLLWYQDLDRNADSLDSVTAYGRFLEAAQLESGALPTYFRSDLIPAKQLRESATTAISGAVLAKLATLTADRELESAALAAGRFVDTHIIPGLGFDDFEAYYSCSPKPLHAADYWSGIRPHNNLSIQWACDQFLALYELTDDEYWLQRGEYLLAILSLYQQVWNPSHLDGYLFGGFGVMNTDGEWNDGRQARFVSTYADYYTATGKTEYLERAVAACRSSFALMDMPENHDNGINKIVLDQAPGLGYAPENIHHTGANSGYGWTGLNWSSGGGLAASAYLERRFGGVWVDGDTQTAFPIDGADATVDSWQGNEIHLTVASALEQIPSPYREPRFIVIRFGHIAPGDYKLTINDQPQAHSSQELEAGVVSQL